MKSNPPTTRNGSKHVPSLVVGMLCWLVFYYVRSKEGKFGNGSLIAFNVAVLSTALTDFFISRFKKRHRSD